MKSYLIQKSWKDIKDFLKEETKKHSLIRYILLILVLTAYFLFVSYKFGAVNGLLVTILSWSFFVFCTPIADAGFILDFPIRLITGMRMIYSEIIVWGIAALINVFILAFHSELYNKTLILKLFHYVISQPFPYGGIILLSAVGTFLSVYFCDELIDVSTHKQRKKYHRHMNMYKTVLFVFIIALTLILYNFLLIKLGVKIPLI